MIDFSSIKNKNLLSTTQKDQLLANWSSETGLEKDQVERLYENFAVNLRTEEGTPDLKRIDESFSDFINPNSRNFDFVSFKSEILEISERLIDPNINIQERDILVNQFIKCIENYCSFTPDIIVVIEIICFVLLTQNKSKFEGISNKIQFGQKSTNLFESAAGTADLGVIQLQKPDAKKLYENLKIILGKNNKRWGNNYHLDNAYQAIVSYLDTEIEGIVNQDNINTVNDTFHMDLMNMIIKEKELNPMYRNIDVLRKLIPDIQTLVFDCLAVVNTYVEVNQEAIKFLNRNNYIDYIEATKLLYSCISSSKESSKITTFGEIENALVDQSKTIFDDLRIDSKKFDIYTYPIQVKSAVDCLHIVKSTETEVNLKIRKIINLYFTKAMNLVASTDHVLLEMKKVNKFKN